MDPDLDTPMRSGQPEWGHVLTEDSSTLHQISPYIGKLKPGIASHLISRYSERGDIVVDPFCGSGTVPLEARLQGRRVFAADDNPYAFVLTAAKLRSPANEAQAVARAVRALAASERRLKPDLRRVPLWVRAFFHPETLSAAIRFADECIERRDYFLLACFLGVLHHQRPGFLSYPSSHLVPYLREKKYPRKDYPEMYEPRDLAPRLLAKIARTYKHVRGEENSHLGIVLRRASIENVTFPGRVGALITSPPYMNALDYRRDNRLRLWFLDRSTTNYSPEPTDRAKGLLRMTDVLARKASGCLRNGGHLVLVVGETVDRKRIRSHPSETFAKAILDTGVVKLVEAFEDKIPDIRRSRRDCRGTKTEHVLVFRKFRRGQ